MLNKYVFELDWLEFDYDSLYRICTAPNKPNSDIQPYQRLVESDPYMKWIQSQYPFLGKVFNVYCVDRPGLPIHIDAKRRCAVNIPVKNTQDSSTIWYESTSDMKTHYEPSRVAHIVDTPVSEVFRHTLQTPTLINVTIPHSVETRSTGSRITISWGLTESIDYDQACRLFLE